MSETETQPKAAPIVIKKYANRRLYDTASSSYVTLDHLAHLVKGGVDFVVQDAKTGEDITRSVLTQIIVEEEAKGQHLLPISFLRQLISLYGDSMQWAVPTYLEQSMQAFAHNQKQVREVFQNTLTGMFPFGNLEDMGKKNMAMMERTMRMFSPFGMGGNEPPATPPQTEETLTDLQRQIEELQRRVGELNGKK